MMIAACIGAGIVYLIGVFNVSETVIEHRSMKEYRDKYGKDLGLLLCTLYRSLMIGAWPVTIGIKYLFGVVGDVIRLVMDKNPKTENDK